MHNILGFINLFCKLFSLRLDLICTWKTNHVVYINVCFVFCFFVQDTVSADVVSSTEQILEQAEAADSKVTLNLLSNGRSLFDHINVHV